MLTVISRASAIRAKARTIASRPDRAAFMIPGAIGGDPHGNCRPEFRPAPSLRPQAICAPPRIGDFRKGQFGEIGGRFSLGHGMRDGRCARRGEGVLERPPAPPTAPKSPLPALPPSAEPRSPAGRSGLIGPGANRHPPFITRENPSARKIIRIRRSAPAADLVSDPTSPRIGIDHRAHQSHTKAFALPFGHDRRPGRDHYQPGTCPLLGLHRDWPALDCADQQFRPRQARRNSGLAATAFLRGSDRRLRGMEIPPPRPTIGSTSLDHGGVDASSGESGWQCQAVLLPVTSSLSSTPVRPCPSSAIQIAPSGPCFDRVLLRASKSWRATSACAVARRSRPDTSALTASPGIRACPCHASEHGARI